MKWTKQPPTEPGWYWWRARKTWPMRARQITCVQNGELVVWDSDEWDYLEDEAGGEWAGPIPEPQEGDE